MPKVRRPLPLFDDLEGVAPKIERALQTIVERPAILHVEITGVSSEKRTEHGLYCLIVSEGEDVVTGARLSEPEKGDSAEVVLIRNKVLETIEDIRATMKKAGLSKPRLVKYNLSLKAS